VCKHGVGSHLAADARLVIQVLPLSIPSPAKCGDAARERERGIEAEEKNERTEAPKP